MSDFRHKDCVYQVVESCTTRACKPAEDCPRGATVFRNEYRGGAGHHHLNQAWEPGELVAKSVRGPSPDAIINDEGIG